MGFFDAFYVMSYTASTIGFGEIPYPFTYNQRMWVTISIYLTVVGWAYAIGSLLALLQERGFRQALALQHFTRKVRRLREPFLLIAGYGRTGELLARSLDALGRRFVVIDQRRRRASTTSTSTPTTPTCPASSATRGDPGPPRRRGPRPPLLRGGARAHRRRRGQPRRHPDRGAAAAGPAGDRPDRLAGDGRADAAPSARRRWSTRSTGSATTSASPCARPRPTSC